MNKSIQHFNEKSTKELGIIAKNFFEDPTKLDEMVDGVLETLLSFGLSDGKLQSGVTANYISV